MTTNRINKKKIMKIKTRKYRGGENTTSEPQTVSQDVTKPETTTAVTSKDSPGAKLLENAQNSEILDTAKNAFKNAAGVLDEWIPHSLIREYAGDKFANKDWSDVAPNFFNNINDTAELISYAASDPELRKVLERTIHVYGNALKDIFKIAKPTIDELTDTFWETVDNMGVKSARGAVNATIDTISAAVAEVPGLGGAVDAVIALSKWFNAVNSGIIAPTITFNGEMTGIGIKTVRDTLAYTKHQGGELAKTYNEFNNMMDDAKKLKNNLQPTNNYAPNMSGGNNSKANKTLRSIRSSVKRFTQKHIVKPRFG